MFFGGVPFRPGDPCRLFGATDVGRASIKPCSVEPIIDKRNGLSRENEYALHILALLNGFPGENSGESCIS